MDNGGSPDGDDRQSNRSDSRQGSDREGSHHSENGHSPRPSGRSRSRFVYICSHGGSIYNICFFKGVTVTHDAIVVVDEADHETAIERNR